MKNNGFKVVGIGASLLATSMLAGVAYAQARPAGQARTRQAVPPAGTRQAVPPVAPVATVPATAAGTIRTLRVE